MKAILLIGVGAAGAKRHIFYEPKQSVTNWFYCTKLTMTCNKFLFCKYYILRQLTNKNNFLTLQ